MVGYIYNKIQKITSISKIFGVEYAFIHFISYFLKKIDYDRKLNHYRVISNFYNFLNNSDAVEELKKIDSENVEEVFYFAYNFYRGLIRPWQVDREFIRLLEIFKNLKPKIILEIGTYIGGTLFCFCKLAPDDATIISIDLPFWGIKKDKVDSYITNAFRYFVKPTQKLYLLRENSQSIETVKKLEDILQGRKIDFIFIDGDHSYEAVKKDFELYSKFINTNGIIAFHDISPLSDNSEDVGKFWNELKSNKNLYNYKDYEEIIVAYNLCGIGVLYF